MCIVNATRDELRCVALRRVVWYTGILVCCVVSQPVAFVLIQFGLSGDREKED